MGNPAMSKAKDDFKLEWHGNAVVITPAANVESMRWDLIEQAADIVMGPLRNQEVPMVVFDLSDVGYFGSVFLALLLRCHKLVKSRGGELVLCGASDLAKELLRVTAPRYALGDLRNERTGLGRRRDVDLMIDDRSPTPAGGTPPGAGAGDSTFRSRNALPGS